jgi:predicted TIM-barrel fold metal-dependent hydrolase
MVRDQVGTDHMLMGSDFPHLLGNIDRAVSSIEDLPIPAHERRAIFSTTALSILNNPWSVEGVAP